MQQLEWSTLSPQICQLAREAGDAIMCIYQEAAETQALVTRKSDDSPLTLADLAAHHILVNGLARLTPHIPVVSEEDSGSFALRTAKGCFWLIDPLDGTKEFLARNGEFTVNVALVVDGESVWGAVYAPALDQMFWGGLEMGSFRQTGGQAASIFVSPAVSPGQVYRVVASKSHLNTETLGFIEQLGTAELVQAGSSLKFCRIAEGHADVYPRLAPTCEWDTAAAQAVLEGAGGQVYDTAGDRLQYGKPDVLNPGFIAASVPLQRLGGAR